MSKIYDCYLKLKKENDEYMYLFKCGKFYIFLSDDCDKINEYLVLKKTKFSNECMKCGFPIDSLNDYLRVFKNHNLKVRIIDEYNDNVDIIEFIKSIDCDNITPLQALIYLKDIKNKL